MNTAPWYVSSFNEEYLRLDQLVHPPERTRTEVEDILRLLRLSPGSMILDLCCGYGRHSIELSKLGYRVVGLDISEYLLDRAKADSERASVEIDWIMGDMRDLPTSRNFDAVINVSNSFGYLETDEEDQRVLEQVSGVLDSGGLFVQELPSLATSIRTFQPTRVSYLPDDSLIVERFGFELATSRVNHEIRRYDPENKQKLKEVYSADARLRLYSPTEMMTMLRAAGLQVQSVHGGLDGRELTLDSSSLVVLSRKQ